MRTDVPVSALRSSSRVAIATEWLGRLAAVIAMLLFVFVMMAIHKGLVVQNSARQIVQDFHTANNYFDSRADFNAAARAKDELQRLQGVLGQLNDATAQDVGNLSATLPDVAHLLAAGKGDVAIAGQLKSVATTLQGSATNLHNIAGGAQTSVATVDDQLAAAIALVNQLNGQLAITERKLSALPSTGR